MRLSIICASLAFSLCTTAMADNAQVQSDYKSALKACTTQPKPTRKACVAEAKQVRDAALHCKDCGVITHVSIAEAKADNSAVGMVAGGVLGGLLGNQLGNGNGRKLATVAGAAGGALAGNEVAKRVGASKNYQYTVRMTDGSSRTVTLEKQEKDPGFNAGDKVKVSDGRIEPR